MEDKQKRYLDKVLEFLMRDTIISSDDILWVSIETPFEDYTYSRIRFFDYNLFREYCENIYGLTREESMYLWSEYMYEINQILKTEWGIFNPEYS